MSLLKYAGFPALPSLKMAGYCLAPLLIIAQLMEAAYSLSKTAPQVSSFASRSTDIEQTPKETQELALNKPVKRNIDAAERHLYRIYFEQAGGQGHNAHVQAARARH